ncbi:uncharacterized protein LOC130728855 isoform X2 [Lotus japonicus]|nr:uncharacterized protein LOC130728855 isoform X2 [Lotus japonicus]
MSSGKKKGAYNNNFSSMKDASEKLLKALQDDRYSRIELCGKRGSGKTTLVKSETKKYEKIFSRVIFLNMFKKDLKSMNEEMANLQRREKTNSETTLFILDNFPTRHSLDDIGLSRSTLGPQRKVLLITDDEADCTRHYKFISQRKRICDSSISMERISDDEAWELLHNLTTGIDSRLDLLNVAREVALQCKGLPGLINDVVSSLDNKNTMKYWKESLDNLHHSTACHHIYFSANIESACLEFTKSLHGALVQQGFKIIPKASFHLSRKNFKGLEEEIAKSRCSIIVISKEYARDFKGLQELVKILKCKETIQQLILPIFYNVDPSDVRDVKRSFKDGLQHAKENAMEEMKQLYNEEAMLKEWTSALYELGRLPGKQYIKGSQDNFIQEIIDHVKNNKHRLHVKHVNGQEGRLCSYDKDCTGD